MLTDVIDDAPATPPAEDAPAFNDGVYSREGYAWAVDAYWVYENLGERMNKTKAKSPGRWALWQFAKKDTDNFVRHVLPKAMSLLEKAREKSGDDGHVIEKEKKAIKALKKLLSAAVAESGISVG